MRPHAVLATLFLAGIAGPTQAGNASGSTCPDGVEATLRKALASNTATASASKGVLLQLDCVAVPDARRDALHAVASFRDDATRSQHEGGEGESYAFILATLDGASRIRHHIEATAIEDATTLFLGGEFRLDTGFDDIAPSGGVVGLAVAHSARGASAPDNRWGDEFALFVPEGGGFRRVLGLARERQEAIEGCVNVQCRGARWINTTATLMPGRRGADGWRRIDVRLAADEYAVEPAVAQSEPSSTALTLSISDGAYRQPDGSPPPGSEYFGLVPW